MFSSRSSECYISRCKLLGIKYLCVQGCNIQLREYNQYFITLHAVQSIKLWNRYLYICNQYNISQVYVNFLKKNMQIHSSIRLPTLTLHIRYQPSWWPDLLIRHLQPWSLCPLTLSYRGPIRKTLLFVLFLKLESHWKIFFYGNTISKWKCN